jgi:hypothetical protein
LCTISFQSHSCKGQQVVSGSREAPGIPADVQISVVCQVIEQVGFKPGLWNIDVNYDFEIRFMSILNLRNKQNMKRQNKSLENCRQLQ